ncbi:hypothetical protein CGJ21_21570, partial [Vibrio parahaemolyticus]
LGTHNAVENGLTKPKSSFGKKYYRANFQQVNRLLKQKTQTTQETKARFSLTQKLKTELKKQAKNTWTLALNILL